MSLSCTSPFTSKIGMGTRWSTPLRVIIANFIFKTDWMALDRCHHLSTNAALQALLLRMKTAAQRFAGLPLAHLLCDFLELVVLRQRSLEAIPEVTLV